MCLVLTTNSRLLGDVMTFFSVEAFDVAALPRIIFGPGRVKELASLAKTYGSRALLVSGKRSFKDSSHWQPLIDSLDDHCVHWEHVTVEKEPSPGDVDGIVSRFHDQKIDVVLGIGGGSALDTAKAAAGLLPHGNSVMDHLEGVGRGIAYKGPAVPLIAVPTTAGTGSEATKNAVLSDIGDDGFKKSFRHDSLVPKIALLDSDLLRNLPVFWMAAQAMDALTQLIESIVSTKASPFTVSLAMSGIEAVRDGLFDLLNGNGDITGNGRNNLMYAALVSGVALAQTGLGVVHGLASPLGAFFPIPHGVVCGTLLATATRVNIEALIKRHPDHASLNRYSLIEQVLTSATATNDKRDQTESSLIDTLTEWTNRLGMPRLGEYGVTDTDITRILAHCRGGSMKTNPVKLNDDEVAAILFERL